MDPNWGWLAVWLLWGSYEAWALWRRRDALQPNTYWIRKVPWVVRFIAIAWLVQHFLVCGSPC